MESITGKIKNTLSHKISKWSRAGIPWFFGLLEDETKIAGEMIKPERYSIIGETYRFYGRTKPDGIFQFEHYELSAENSIKGTAAYLHRHIDGIGLRRATAIVNHFGTDTMHILRTDIGQCFEIPGFTESVAEAIHKHFAEECVIDPAAYAKLIDLLEEFRPPKKLLRSLVEDWGSNAPIVIMDKPYILLNYPRMGWETVDRFAIQKAKYDPKGIDRQKASILESIKRNFEEGHTFSDRAEIEPIAFTLTGSRPTLPAWVALLEEGRITAESAEALDNQACVVSFPKLESAERYIAYRLRAIYIAGRKLPDSMELKGLEGEQISEGRKLLAHPVCLIAGPPGAGKSTLASSYICAYSEFMGPNNIRVMAPTGKAAKRASELLGLAFKHDKHGIPSTTIHSALGIAGNDEETDTPRDSAKGARGRNRFGFLHDESNTLSESIYSIEEMSMVSTVLFAASLAAIPLGSRVIISGDPDQLPSIEPGACHRDMISAGIPTCLLTEIRRSDGGGDIVKACHAIRKGVMPKPSAKLDLRSGHNWIHFEVEDDQIADVICSRIAKVQAGSKNNFDPIWGVQVISPQKKIASFGTFDLNERLSRQLNQTESKDAGDSDDLRFRIGDKVVRNRNGKVKGMVEVEIESDSQWNKAEDFYMTQKRGNIQWNDCDYWLVEKTIVNGDQGIVRDITIDDRESCVIVEFRDPIGLCRLNLAECHLERGFAQTTHKCQGDQYKYVLLPLSDQFFWKQGRGLWFREQVYTAFSRAEMVLATVGSLESLRTAIGRRTIHRRRTRLADRIREAWAIPLDSPTPAREDEQVDVLVGHPDDDGIDNI